MANNSSYTIQNLVDMARSIADLAPTLPTGGFYETVALMAANDAMLQFLNGSSRGSRFNWKFNRIIVPPFFINSWQQDYLMPMANVGWLESAGAYNICNQFPKPYRPMEVKRDTLLTNAQTGNLAKINWMNNNSLTLGTWGQTELDNLSGLAMPGPGVVYYNPTQQPNTPANPCTSVQDANGNCWLAIVAAFDSVNPGGAPSTGQPIIPPSGIAVGGQAVCGGPYTPYTINGRTYTDPFGPTSYATYPTPAYPTLANPYTSSTIVTDGTVKWMACNPLGQGMRINPLPTQTGPNWQISVIAQAAVAPFTKIGQYCNPVPDDYFPYFRRGFFTYLYQNSADPKVRAKFDEQYKIWMQSLDLAVNQGSREDDDWGFVPSNNVMDTGWAFNPVNPAMPYGPWQG
jgi:hypothetical protein